MVKVEDIVFIPNVAKRKLVSTVYLMSMNESGTNRRQMGT